MYKAASLLFCMVLAAAAAPPIFAQDDGTSGNGKTSPALLANARKFLEQRAKLRSGESVLLIGDRSGDALVRASLYQAAKDIGATWHELILQGHPELTDGFEIARQMRFKVWWPDWIWKAASGVDVVLEMTSLGGAHIPLKPPVPERTRMVHVPFANRVQLADPRARGNYPEEIVQAIAKVVWQQIRGGRVVHVSDPEGTDLEWSLDASAWADAEKNDPNHDPGHLAMPAPFHSHPPDAHGSLAGSSTHSGPLAPQRMRVENGRAVEVIGGENMGDYLRAKFAEYSSIQFPSFPGPGANWIEETTIGTDPAYSRTPGAEHFGWWGEMQGWIGAPRAGVFHIAVGTSNSGRTFQFVQDHGLEVQHWDIELYSPTLTVDGHKIIDRGHLIALEDPAVRKIAAQFGNPDELLKVTWMPLMKQ